MAYQLFQKLKFLKKKMQEWSQDVFGNIQQRKIQLLSDIQNLDGKEEAEISKTWIKKEGSLVKGNFRVWFFTKKLNGNNDLETNGWKQVIEIQKNFHMAASARRQVNQTKSIIARGRLWENKVNIENEVASFSLFFSSYILVITGQGRGWMESLSDKFLCLWCLFRRNIY